jgi:hypothetical protein
MPTFGVQNLSRCVHFLRKVCVIYGKKIPQPKPYFPQFKRSANSQAKRIRTIPIQFGFATCVCYSGTNLIEHMSIRRISHTYENYTTINRTGYGFSCLRCCAVRKTTCWGFKPGGHGARNCFQGIDTTARFHPGYTDSIRNKNQQRSESKDHEGFNRADFQTHKSPEGVGRISGSGKA